MTHQSKNLYRFSFQPHGTDLKLQFILVSRGYSVKRIQLFLSLRSVSILYWFYVLIFKFILTDYFPFSLC